MEELGDKRILVLGSQGMAGHIVMSYFKRNGYQVYGVAREIYRSVGSEQLLDVSDFDALKSTLELGRFDIVINAVGVLIGGSISDKKRAFELNGVLPNLLHSWSAELGFRLILISTDCVFDGKSGLYSEFDRPNANDIYGMSKRMGELIGEVQRTLIIRTSIIGPELKKGTGLWYWFENQKDLVSGFTQAYWSGITTLELAKFMEYALKHNITGLKQVSNGRPISKFNLLYLMKELGVNSHIEIKENSELVSNKTLLASDLHGYTVSTYRNMIREQLEFELE